MQKRQNEFKTISLILESSFVEICKSLLLPLIPNGVLVRGRVVLTSEKTDLCSINFNHFVSIPHDFKTFDNQEKVNIFKNYFSVSTCESKYSLFSYITSKVIIL